MSKGMNSTILILSIALILMGVSMLFGLIKNGNDLNWTKQKIQFIGRDSGETIDDFMFRVMKIAEQTPNVWIVKGKLGLFGTGKAEMIMPANIQWLPNEFGEVSAAIVWWWEREAEMEKR